MSYLHYDPPSSPTGDQSDELQMELLDPIHVPSILDLVRSDDTMVYDPWVTSEDQRRLKKHFKYACPDDATYALAEVPIHRLQWGGERRDELHINDELLHIRALGSLQTASFHTDKYTLPRFSIHLELIRNADHNAMSSLFSFGVPNRIAPDDIVCTRESEHSRQAFWDILYAPIRIRPDAERIAFSSLRRGDVILAETTIRKDVFGMPAFYFDRIYLLCMAPRDA